MQFVPLLINCLDFILEKINRNCFYYILSVFDFSFFHSRFEANSFSQRLYLNYPFHRFLFCLMK